MPTTAGTIKHRHQSAIANNPAYDVSSTKWNDSFVVASGTNGDLLVRDSTQTDGWGWQTVLPVANGGTGITSYAVGDLLYASGATTLSKLADVAVGAYLRSGGVGAAPLWSTLILPNAATQGDLIVATAANTLGSVADVAAGQVLVSGGVGAVPAYSANPTVTSLTASSAISVGPTPATTGDIRLRNGGTFYFRNFANTADVQMFYTASNDLVGFGDGAHVMRLDVTRLVFNGETSACPALKRNGANLEVRLADDSAYSGLAATTFGDAAIATRVRSSLATPGSLADGDWWVECSGSSPSRICAIKVRDGGATRTIASVTY